MADMFEDIQSSRLIIAKGFLFLCLGILSSMVLVVHTMDLKVALLLAISVWAFCRFYYFAFYVVEKYVDDGFRFDGLYAFAIYWIRSRSKRTE